MSERVREIVEKGRTGTNYRWPFPEIFEAILTLALEVDTVVSMMKSHLRSHHEGLPKDPLPKDPIS
jgi:hypothetical protein